MGISTLVATVLILGVVVSLVGIVGAWSTGYLDVLLGRSGVVVTIENVEFRGCCSIIVTIMNKGVSETTVKAVFINNKEIGNWSLSVDSTEDLRTIKPDQIGRITTFLDFPWDYGTRYAIKITTSGYSPVTTEVTSPETP